MTIACLADTASHQSDILFGVRVAPAAVRIVPVARGTRGIYRVHTDGCPSVILKCRSFETPAEREKVEIETSHEYDVLSAVWTSMGEHGAGKHEVPRPLLALPESGLLFMTQSRGEPLARVLRRWVIGLHSLEDVSQRLRQCGEWLRTFSHLTPRIAWPAVAPQAAAVLGQGRVRHHVYKLIGLSSADLTTTIVSGATARLTAWKVDADFIRRIEGAFSRQFKDFGGSRDAQVAVHGKFSPADVLMQEHVVSAVDLEQAGKGSVYLDPAYFLYQVYMTARWRIVGGGRKVVAELRRSFLNGRSDPAVIDESLLDCFIAYYMCNSLRPGGGLAGMTARSSAHRWIEGWLARAGS
ncbi:MAG: hypothetical protein HOP16_11835 [Acidobacteria bacterium]|nr:hypothetical protein [Acidobacteriota bacterium]